MLKRLSISNYALIERADIEFGPGLNILTGETGAGKSLVVGAISTLVGERISPDVIGQNSVIAAVEGEFDLSEAPDLQKYLANQGYDVETTILIRREIHPKRTRGLICDQVASLAQVKELMERLLDLHGQHDHQSLLRKEIHLDYLDACGNHRDLLIKMKEAFYQHQSLSKEITNLHAKLKSLREAETLHHHELEIIQKANPVPDEDQSLEQEAHRLQHAEEIYRYTYEIQELLNNSEHSILTQLNLVRKQLEHLKSLDSSWESNLQDLETADSTLKEIARFTQEYHHRIEFAPDRLEQIQERLQTLSALKRRFGGTLESVIARADELKNEMQLSEVVENKIASLTPELEKASEALNTIAQALSQARKQTATPLTDAIKHLLSQVGIPEPEFQIRWDNVGENPEIPGVRGIDNVEFFLSANPGEPVRRLVQIASGGEISRVMLALKAVLADAGGTYTMVFDEIDNGISGRIARKVGMVLRQLAKHRQLIVITHLPQIASLGHHHLKVSKHQRDGRTFTEITPLEPRERVEEIASLMAGAKITEQVRASAQELLTNLN